MKEALMRKFMTAAALTATAAAAVLGTQSRAAASPDTPKAQSTGWVRLAHMSPYTSVSDVYLYSFGSQTPQVVFHHVALSSVSPYEPIPSGEYTIAVRTAGQSQTAPPMLKTVMTVAANKTYTVAGIGDATHEQLVVTDDAFKLLPGKTLVRVMQGSVSQNQASVSVGQTSLGTNLSYGAVTSYVPVAPGAEVMTVTGDTKKTTTTLHLAANTVHSILILDDGSGLAVHDMTDAVGTAATPQGAAATGLGGTAPHPASPLPWLALILAGAAAVIAGSRRRAQSVR
jgi:hypothetical protein